jgi:hypothetical protein
VNPTPQHLVAAALAALGTASAIPIPLAQLDFAGVLNVFDIDDGDTPTAVLTIAAVGGVLTIAVLALALVGVFLALAGVPSARTVLIASAVAGFATATPFWIPAGVVLGASAHLLGKHNPTISFQRPESAEAHP